MKQFLLIILLIIIIPFQLISLYSKNNQPGTVAGVNINKQSEVFNSLSIGEYRFSLYGFTSPFALVTFEGMGIYDQTTADYNGRFQFNNRFSPFSPREACLAARDQFGRLSSPLCLSPFPVNYNVNIGPVIMPPTISLDKNDYFMGDEVILSGQAVPDTRINLSIFRNTQVYTNGNTNRHEPFAFFRVLFRVFSRITQPVMAASPEVNKSAGFSFPNLTINSDNKGNFSINLPSSNPEKFRLFAQTDFEKSISPNSIKLNFEILPVWMIIIKFFLFLFSFIRPRLLEIAIISEVIVILYLLKGHFQKKAIVLKERFSLMKSRSTQIILSTPNA